MCLLNLLIINRLMHHLNSGMHEADWPCGGVALRGWCIGFAFEWDVTFLLQYHAIIYIWECLISDFRNKRTVFKYLVNNFDNVLARHRSLFLIRCICWWTMRFFATQVQVWDTEQCDTWRNSVSQNCLLDYICVPILLNKGKQHWWFRVYICFETLKPCVSFIILQDACENKLSIY